MYIQHQFEVVQAALGKALVPQDAGIVHQDVDAAPLVHGLLDHGLDLVVFRHVGAVGDSLAAQGLDLRHHGLGGVAGAAGAVLGAAQVIDHHPGTAFGQFNGVTAAQALARPGNNGYFAVITDRHLFPPCALLKNNYVSCRLAGNHHGKPLGDQCGRVLALDLY